MRFAADAATPRGLPSALLFVLFLNYPVGP